jgi:hypothetical protein
MLRRSLVYLTVVSNRPSPLRSRALSSALTSTTSEQFFGHYGRTIRLTGFSLFSHSPVTQTEFVMLEILTQHRSQEGGSYPESNIKTQHIKTGAGTKRKRLRNYGISVFCYCHLGLQACPRPSTIQIDPLAFQPSQSACQFLMLTKQMGIISC